MVAQAHQEQAIHEVITEHAIRHQRIMHGEEQGPATAANGRPNTVVELRRIIDWWRVCASHAADEMWPEDRDYHGGQAVAYDNVIKRLDEYLAGGDSQEELDLFVGGA